ncbi:MAG: DUF89 family protein [Candidatus Eisenbacteria sp.]|nr:DUF89 family protein [Candidatus Eisenbacteria bacterium]
MRTYLDCISCFVRQALDASRMVTTDAAVHERVVRETLRLAVEMRFDRSPPWMAQQIHRLLREATGNPDPYREAKRRSNELALRLYPRLEEQVRAADDSFTTALGLAIAGNVIDFGCRSRIDDDDVQDAIADALNTSLEPNAVADLRRAVGEASDILYLADNAGEIVFDRLLIGELPRERVTLVVRGSPVINDATREDAQIAGLDALVPVIDNGSDAPGTILGTCSPAFRDRFAQSDLVIAKGQGNYETLSGQDAPIVFLFKAKCPVIAQDVGCAVGALVVSLNVAKPPGSS